MPNLGSLDRVIRAVLGVILIAAPWVLSGSLFAASWAFWGSIAVGLILLATAAISFCPIYAVLGLRSRPRT